MRYNTAKIEDLCTLVTSGGTPLTSISSYYNPKEVPWLKTGEVNYCPIYDTENYISKEGLAHSSAKMIPANSIIIAMYGQGDTAGRVAINKIPLCTNQACCNLIINHNIADYEFVYYSLCTLYDHLVALKNGGAQPNLNAKKIKAINIPFPDIEVQHKIASILSTYDSLIENNRKQIKLLEEAAQRLYKEWFVDLRFPGYETTSIVDGVPEGWKKVSVADVSCVLRRGISPKYNENAKYTVINQKCIRQTVVDFSESRKQEKPYPDELQLMDSDTVICSTGAGTLGRVGQIFGEHPSSTLDSHVTLVRSNDKIGKQYLFLSIKEQQDYLQSMGKGSTNQLELSRTTIQELPILIPDAGIIEKFENTAEPIHKKIENLNSIVAVAMQTRDRLLPKLMSGKLEV